MIGASELNDVALKDGELMLDPDVDGINALLILYTKTSKTSNLMGPKTLPMIWGTYMKLVTKYQISAINSC
jgi:hypothetical protein